MKVVIFAFSLEACMAFLLLEVLMCPSFMTAVHAEEEGASWGTNYWNETLERRREGSRILSFPCKVKAHHPI